jgi:hypothetical protein
MPSEGSLEDIKEIIELFLLDYPRPLLTEPGQDVVDLAASSYSLAMQHDRLLWHIWNENTNLVRQITALDRAAPGRIELRYQRFGKGPPGKLVVADSRALPGQLDRRTRRTQYIKALRRWLLQLFPLWKVQELTTEPDLARSFSGRYARGWITRGKQAWAVIGSDWQEGDAAPEDILAYGLLWMDWLRQQNLSHVVEGLKIFLPRGASEVTLNRLAWLNPHAGKWELYESGWGTGEEIRQRDPADFGNLKTTLPRYLRPTPEPSMEVEAEFDAADVKARIGPDGRWCWSICGLVFARETPRGIVFGLGRNETALDAATAPQLRRLVSRIAKTRRANSTNTHDPLYRAQPERWMQSLVANHLDRIESSLAGGVVYEQVPAVSGTARGLLDLLAVNASGRLAVIELKASEDLQLPLQALDYWMRVEWHHRRNEFAGQGYFPGRELSPEPPLLLLVSPALQFHSACDVILRYISPAVEIVRVGLNEEWRKELQVVFRQGQPASRVR